MPRIIALDAGVLVLLVVGLTNPKLIERHKRLEGYTINDFEFLLSILERYDEAVVIPNALTEAGNFLKRIAEPARSQIFMRFRYFIENTREVYIESRTAVHRTEFVRLGLTDSAELELARRDIFILVADGPLCRAALDAGYQAAHFRELTEYGRFAAS